MENKGRKYVGIAKIGYNKELKNPICCKYRFNDINKFISFVTVKFPAVAWINIYERKGVNKNKLAYTWGNIKGLCPAN